MIRVIIKHTHQHTGLPVPSQHTDSGSIRCVCHHRSDADLNATVTYTRRDQQLSWEPVKLGRGTTSLSAWVKVANINNVPVISYVLRSHCSINVSVWSNAQVANSLNTWCSFCKWVILAYFNQCVESDCRAYATIMCKRILICLTRGLLLVVPRPSLPTLHTNRSLGLTPLPPIYCEYRGQCLHPVHLSNQSGTQCGHYQSDGTELQSRTLDGWRATANPAGL